MRLLADESLDMAVVRALREAGHDVKTTAEKSPGASDEEVAELAKVDDRILLTEDRDFGRLVYADLCGARGVIFMRYPAKARTQIGGEVANLIDSEGERLNGAFVVMQPGRARISRLPETLE